MIELVRLVLPLFASTDRLDISKLQDPTFVENMARSYLVQNASSSQTNSSGSSLLSLFA